LEEVQTPMENGKLMNYAQSSLKYSFKMYWKRKRKRFRGNNKVLIVCAISGRYAQEPFFPLSKYLIAFGNDTNKSKSRTYRHSESFVSSSAK
jgi:hypothetical protein